MVAEPLDEEFLDEADKKFYEVAKQCGAIFEFIDALFGDGTSEKLFGGHTNLVDCANVYYKIIDEIKKDSSAIPTLNREQRRKSKK